MADATVGFDRYRAKFCNDAGSSGADNIFDFCYLFVDLCDYRIFSGQEAVRGANRDKPRIGWKA